MEIVEVECKNCRKKIYVQNEYIRDQMFCTLSCLDTFNSNNGFRPCYENNF